MQPDTQQKGNTNVALPTPGPITVTQAKYDYTWSYGATDGQENYIVWCDVTYSDGTTSKNVDVSQGQVPPGTFEANTDPFNLTPTCNALVGTAK